MKVTEKQQMPLSYNWRVRTYPKGTVKLKDFPEDCGYAHNGKMIVPTCEPTSEQTGQNLIVTLGKAFPGLMMIDAAAAYDTGVTYCALGADNTAPALTDTQLVDEGGGGAMRKLITSRTQGVAPNTNQFTFSTFFTAAECTLAIEEAGVFGSSTAGVAENSGVLCSRWLVSVDNSLATSDITIDWVLSIG